MMMTQIIFYSVFQCMCTYPSKLKATTKKDIRKHLCSCRPLAQGHWSCTPIHWNRYFYSYTIANLLKDIFRSSFYHCVVFLSIHGQRNRGFQRQKISCMLEIQPGFRFFLLLLFFLHKTKMSKQHMFII